MGEVPAWVNFIGSGAIFVLLFGGMVKWIMNGIKDTMKAQAAEIKGLANAFHSLDKEIVRHEHLPKTVEKLTDRVRDTESSTEAAWNFLRQKYPNEIRASNKEV